MDGQMKKLLIFVNSMNAFGGIERVIANLSNRFTSYYDVTILVKDLPKSAYQLNEKVKIESLNCPLIMNMGSRLQRILSVPINSILSIIKLRKYLKNSDFDVVYTAFPTNGFEVYLAEKSYRNKIVASEHASYYAYNKVYKNLKKYLYPKLPAISVPTTMDTEIYKGFGYNAEYIPHLTTYDSIGNVNKDSHTIINVGRLTSDKQQMMLLKIWEMVNDRIPQHDWKLQIIGSGEEEANLLSYIKQSELVNVEMIPHTSNIKEYYNNAELFVFTSKMEGFGMVLLEAMSFGVPCISFDCPSGPRDIIEDNRNGYLIPCYDEKLFAEKICEYIQKNNELKEKMQQEAIDTIRNWNNDNIIQKWLSLFASLEKKI